MFEKITPEMAGASSRRLYEYISSLRRRGIPMHSLLMMKGDKIFAEYYWDPFHKDFNHRQYSQTKSYVGIAIGLLYDDGLVDLDKPISEYFPDKIDGDIPDYLRRQTVREMLTMTTAGGQVGWFASDDPDRTHLYLNCVKPEKCHPAGTLWAYDSAGSQVLSSLVERISGKSLFDFLNERIFTHLGQFKNATVLKTRNGDSWGDSAMICTMRDNAAFARLLMKGGRWEGKQLISEEYVRLATSKQVDNRESAHAACFRHGYGYQIWRCEDDGFAFVGMGNQLAICIPRLDLLFVCQADTQGYDSSRELIVGNFFDMVERFMTDDPLPEDPEGAAMLAEETAELKLLAVQGEEDSPLRESIDGKEYLCRKNPMGITKFCFKFKDRTCGELHYTNAQGDKILPFGVNHNVFGNFPQLGYSGDRGGLRTEDGSTYRDAVSLAWMDDRRVLLNVQIIDRYFGNFSTVFAFKGEECVLYMHKTAEDFLNEYDGCAIADLKK